MRPTLTLNGLRDSIAQYKVKMGQVDEILRQRRETNAKNGELVKCKDGCDHCCYLRVTIGAPDALRLAFALRDAGRDTPELRQRLLDEQLFSDTVPDPLDYFDKHRPCPFLKDSHCSVYEDRPMACRDHYVYGAITVCQTKEGKGRLLNTSDTRADMVALWKKFSDWTWMVPYGPMPGMILMALRALDGLEAVNGTAVASSCACDNGVCCGGKLAASEPVEGGAQDCGQPKHD